MNPPETRYLERDGAMLAYQIGGDGPNELIHFSELNQHIDLLITDPDIHANIERAGRIGRVVFLQRRGVGLSDQVDYQPTLEQQADDVLAVMDELGMNRVTLFGFLSTCAPMALVAARVPDRVKGLILAAPIAEPLVGEGLPPGWSSDEVARVVRIVRDAADNWGSGATAVLYAPELATASNRRLAALAERCSTTPAIARAHVEWALTSDTSDVFRSVSVPTRVVWLASSPMPRPAALHVAELIPNATLREIPAFPPGTSLGQIYAPIIDHMEEVATGAVHTPESDRFLATVLYTDLVGSTELLADVGDARYRDIRATHEREVRLAVEETGGSLVSVSGDGTLSIFDGPSSAVRCAERICREADGERLAVRCGVHTGEVQRDGTNVTGMTVHIGARVGAAAEAGDVLVSRTVRDLVVGSGLVFASRGEHQLKGVPGSWELFAVTQAGPQVGTIEPGESIETALDRATLTGIRRMPGMSRAGIRVLNAIERRRART